MSEIKDEVNAEASKPKVVFLVAAAVFALVAAFAYLNEEEIIEASGATGFALLLMLSVLVSLCLVLCYRMPRLGNRLLGYDVVITKPDEKGKADMQYSGGFKMDGGADLKRQNSRRKEARYSRKKYAEVTRQMQEEKQAQDEQGTE
ncbi:hypothetical protein [Kordiimonas laminariae]|uniref:hypothetical protein n=1 Tax=Kordiimonas laminariae TaxID=2917717 RepID=UPI001FF591AE|nr:hypothetical protein [Kordiimonas laminariae]MCK0069520.1 hypothetical protein [Kordiimonas laminariae]